MKDEHGPGYKNTSERVQAHVFWKAPFRQINKKRSTNPNIAKLHQYLFNQNFKGKLQIYQT
jgi:hypothetical protein